ncbi:hypothetical protein PQR65_19750 [Paraburkholderia nemoris]|uniref:hypothetical protein n=1 Tax=Paraburkholderia nemoris TaxID=2793076 RepID=UPI0038B9293C
MINGYVIAAAISVLGVIAAYWYQFVIVLGYGAATDGASWENFGSYFGGVAGPVLTFISLLFIIKSFRLQNEANESLKNQLKDNEKSEKLKSFSVLFFNMIESQKNLLEKFKLVFPVNGASVVKRGADAIMSVENDIAGLRKIGASDASIKQYMQNIDGSDQIFGILRAFYISVKMVLEKLSNEEGFSREQREDYLNTLLNFTDFAQLRLVIMGMQFIECVASDYLSGKGEFISVLDDMGIQLPLY